MRCLAEGTHFLGLAVGADAAALARLQPLARRWPVAWRAVAAGGTLAVHLGVAAGSTVLVRPDAYVAAVLPTGDVEALERALGAALGRSEPAAGAARAA